MSDGGIKSNQQEMAYYIHAHTQMYEFAVAQLQAKGGMDPSGLSSVQHDADGMIEGSNLTCMS
jgi:hypothetical protein